MAKLAPPDVERCQAEKPSGGPFILGGEIGDPRNGYLVRCRNKPTFIATENKPGKDGAVGSMSLCDECRKVAIKQMGPNFASFKEIENG